MPGSDFHVHTVYCDGLNTPEEMARAAAGLGMEKLGFSGHGYTSFDSSYCMSRNGTKRYLSDILKLRREYEGSLGIFAGSEWDLFSDGEKDCFDYLIGSVHYFERRTDAVVDAGTESLSAYVKARFGGDYYLAAKCYYENVSQVIEVTGADIIGHFDLITKFNENGELFDTKDPRYTEAWQEAADRLLRTGRPFEVNTGAITRGYRVTPYPADDIIDYIGSRGGSFILSSDSHRASTLMYGFPELEEKILSKGYRLVDMPYRLSV